MPDWIRPAHRLATALRRGVYARKFRAAVAADLRRVRSQGLSTDQPAAAAAATRDFLRTFCGGYRDDRWHRVCAAINGHRSPYYLPEDLYFLYVVPTLSPPERAAAYRDKNGYDRHGWRGLPETRARVIRGRLLDADYQPLDAAGLAERIGGDAVIIKPSLGTGRGRGVTRLQGAAAIDHVRAAVAKGADVIVQTPIRPCEALARVHPGGVPAVRLISLRLDGRLHLFDGVLNVGVGASLASNGSESVQFGLEGDTVRPEGLDRRWNRLRRHPDSGVSLEGFRMAAMAAMRDLCLHAHGRMPDVDLVAWDVTVDEQGNARLLECNIRWQGCRGPQLLNGPVFGALTETVMRRVPVTTVHGWPV